MFTHRTQDRAGVKEHGFGIQPQERTIARALDKVGFATGQVQQVAPERPQQIRSASAAKRRAESGVFGFDDCLLVTDSFERNPENPHGPVRGDAGRLVRDNRGPSAGVHTTMRSRDRLVLGRTQVRDPALPKSRVRRRARRVRALGR